MKKFWWAIFIFSLIGVSMVSFWFFKNNTEVRTSIKIGWPTPITGALASFGEPDPWLAEKITKIVNDQKGGIYIKKYGKKLPIEILVRDTKSDEQYAATVAEELINKEKVDLMIVLHTPTTTVPVSKQCEKYKITCVVFDTPVLGWLEGAPYEWSYLHFWTEPDVAEAHIGMWDMVKDQTNRKAGGLWNDDIDGKNFREAIITVAKEHGYDFVGDEGLIPYGKSDYSTYIRDLMEKKVELLSMTFIPPDFAKFWKQSKAMGFKPKVATIAKSILFPSSIEDLSGNSPQGLTTEIWWSKYHPSISPLTGLTPTQLASQWESESGRQWTQPLFYSLAAFETAIDALTRSESLDKGIVKNAVANTNLNTIVGLVSYKTPLSTEDTIRYAKWPKLIENKSHYSLAPVVGGQWNKGVDWPWEIQTVYTWKYDWIPKTAKMMLMTYE
jgi:branched-chain amino acid transport system substrate-binding protein